MPTLYIVATPIGHLEDITLRALRVLKEVDVILCEDTRVTKKLLDHYGILTPVRTYHQHSGIGVIREIRGFLERGDVALVTDAGTPGLSDPGNELVAAVLELSFLARKLGSPFGRSAKFASGPRTSASELDLPQTVLASQTQSQNLERGGGEGKIATVPIPGPSALTSAASIAGLPMDEFLFLGFLPHKKGRQTAIDEIVASTRTTVLYESKYRIVKLLDELTRRGGVTMNDRRIVVCRELTKQFETVYRGNIEEVLELVRKDPIKGEYVVIIEGMG